MTDLTVSLCREFKCVSNPVDLRALGERRSPHTDVRKVFEAVICFFVL